MKKFFVILIILLTVILYWFFGGNKEEKIKKELLSNTEKENALIDKYIVYGTHLNIEGTIDKKLYEDNIISAELVFITLDNKEKTFNIDYELSDNDKFIFKTSDQINDGINLETLKKGNYYVFIKIKEKKLDNKKKNTTKYYSLSNKTKYKNIEYYTITKDDKNNKININFDSIKFKTLKKDYMNILVKEQPLEKNIYDIVIDAGHGGKDGGAVITQNNKEYAEKDITLDYAKSLKKALETLGLKIKLTRDGTNEEKLGIYDMYGKNGRAVIPNNIKAKYMLSLHLNSTEYKMNNGGIEIYAPSNSKLEFASLLADNLVKYAKTTYSPNVTAKVSDGVYVRNYTKTEIDNSKKNAIESGYKSYNITTDTPYLFIIREPGGIATNAYVDGRNKEYDKNLYFNSNIGVESYLIELGFLNCQNDLNNIINNKDLYVEGIKESLKTYLNL